MSDYTKKTHRYLVQMDVTVEVELDGDVSAANADAAADYAKNLVNGIGNGCTVEDVWQPMVMTNNGWEEVLDI